MNVIRDTMAQELFKLIERIIDFLLTFDVNATETRNGIPLKPCYTMIYCYNLEYMYNRSK